MYFNRKMRDIVNAIDRDLLDAGYQITDSPEVTGTPQAGRTWPREMVCTGPKGEVVESYVFMKFMHRMSESFMEIQITRAYYSLNLAAITHYMNNKEDDLSEVEATTVATKGENDDG